MNPRLLPFAGLLSCGLFAALGLPPAATPTATAQAREAEAARPRAGGPTIEAVLPFLNKKPSANLAQGREALTDRRYADAIRLLELAQAGPEAEEANLLLIYAHFNSKQYASAISACDKLLQSFPESKWRKKALFKKADSLAALGKWGEAAAIYEPELEYIVSVDRREQVAATYLKYADGYFAPAKKEKEDTPRPDFTRAKSLYLKALEIGLTPERSADVLLRAAQSDFESNNFRAAIEGFERVLREYPQSPAAATARLSIGLSYLKAGGYQPARRALRDFIIDYPQHARLGDAYLAIAESYRVPTPPNDRQLELGVAALREFIEKFPEHKRALEAEYWIGLSYTNRNRQENAVREFQAFLGRHGGEKREEVALAKYNLGAALLSQKKFDDAIGAWQNFLRDEPVHRLWNDVQRKIIDAQYAIGDEAYKANSYPEARRAWELFSEKYPLDGRNADIMFRLGMMQYDAKAYDAAVEQWRKVISKYASTDAASRAQYMIALTYEKRDQWDDAFAALKLVQGQWGDEAKSRLATLKARRLVVYTERAFTTKETPSLRLVTRNVDKVELRAYRVDMRDYFLKTHTIKGVDKLDLNLIPPDKAWTVDLKDYAAYREMETVVPMPFQGAGAWAVVCRAVDSKDAKPGDPGAVAETGASATGPVLLATSIVSVTDISIVTKITRNDIFIWAENMTTRQPAPGTKVWVSDGAKIMAQGTTDADGVFHFECKAPEAGDDTTPLVASAQVTLQNKAQTRPLAGRGLRANSTNAHQNAGRPNQGANNKRALPAKKVAAPRKPPANTVEFPVDTVRVLAASGASFASTEGDLGVAQVAALAPTAFLYTDRPLYRPGQAVHLRGIVRQVYKGTYNFTPGAEYALQVSAPGGAAILNRRVQINEWGTFSNRLTLPGEAAPGDYTISLTREATKDGAPVQPLSATGTFSVGSYKLDKVRLEIVPEKTVYLRGETITGKLKAKYYYGEPLRKRKIQFGWKDSVAKEYETDDNGEFSFSFSTRDFEEDEAVRLWAVFGDEQAQSQTTVYVAAVGLNATLTTLRDVYLAGESFDVKVKTTDIAGKAFTGAFTLHALKVQRADTGSGEREIAQQTVQTDKDGLATASFSFKEAGDVILRLQGKDANGNPLTSEVAVQIVGEDEDVRLRVLAETDTLKAGDTTAVRVLWRGPKPAKPGIEPAAEQGTRLALVTYEGERIYGHQLVRLSRGDNTIQLPVDTTLAPLFRLSVSLMEGERLHHAIKWFAVTRELQVKVETLNGEGQAQKAAFLPGGKVRIKVRATDQSGKPVAAELSLAAVDEALLAEGGATLPINSLLGTRIPTNNPVLTTASNTFNFTAEARRNVLEVRQADDFLHSALADRSDVFPDIPSNRWVFEAFEKLAMAGFIESTPMERRSGQRITRHEAAVVLARMAETPEGRDLGPAEVDLVRALNREFADDLSKLGVRTDALEARVAGAKKATLATRNIVPSLLHRTGKADAIGQIARQFDAAAPQGLPQLYQEPAEESMNGSFVSGGVIAAGPPNHAAYSLPARVTALEARQRMNGGVPAIDLSRSNFAETAYWNAHVVTDEKGEAVTEFTLPDSLTEWRVLGRGVTKNTLVGEGADKFTASKPFWVELQAPPLLQSGDSNSFPAIVHNSGDKETQTKLTLRVAFDDGAEKELSESVTVPANGSAEVQFNLDVPIARRAQLTLTASGGDVSDTEKQTIGVRAWGLDRVASSSGQAEGDRNVEVSLPEGAYSGSSLLRIVVGPQTPAALLDQVEKPANPEWRAPLVQNSALRLSTLLKASGYLKKTGNDKPRLERISGDIDSLIARLAAAQDNDGGWRWTLRAPANQHSYSAGVNLRVSAETVVALATARKQGIEVPGETLDKGLAFLTARFQDAAADNENKALILYAQSVGGTADFAFVNGLYRVRNGLDTSSLSLLALTLQQMAREEMAREIIGLLAERTSAEALRAALTKTIAPASSQTLDTGNTEDVALAALAMAEVEPKHTLMQTLVDLLWARRSDSEWPAPRTSSRALSALLEYAVAARRDPEKYTLAIAVDGKTAHNLNVDSNAATSVFEMPLESRRAKVDFDMEGRGAYTYSVSLTGFTSDGLIDDATLKELVDSKKYSSSLRSSGSYSVSRTYQPAPMLWKGKVVPRGFNILSSSRNSWTDYASEVKLGERVRVQVSWNNGDWSNPKSTKSVVLREPIPAGTRVLEDSLRGDFERYELGDREIKFYFAPRNSGAIGYDIYGAQPGRYRVLPSKISLVDQPSNYAFGTYKDFQVIARDAQGRDQVRITPDELYHLGKWSFDSAQEAMARGEEPAAEDVRTAEKNLTELFERDATPEGWKLNKDAGTDITRMLYSLALRRSDNAASVRYFEVVRERYPQLVIPFSEIVQTAKAYGKIGEVEREVQVLRATAEASFRRETGVAGTLVEEGEHRASYAYLAEKAREYPDLANVESAVYTLTQSIAQRAESVAKAGQPDESKALTVLSAETLRDFLTIYTENPVGDEASFSYAVNLIEQERYADADAVAWAGRSRALYKDSSYIDDYDYIATYASFLAENYDEALKQARLLATQEYPQPDGEPEHSTYRPFALYIAAQIHHARGELTPAMELYRQVGEQFPDAREAADFFDQKSLRIPEVTVAKAGEKITLKATARNAGKAQLAVYKVDLLHFYQERRNLLDMRSMNLAGIKPVWESSIDFGANKFADVSKNIALPLPEKGAYFVTLKSDDGERGFASGVVVRSGLEIEVQEDAVSGRVRVNVSRREGAAAGVQPKAEVWAIGNANDEFRKGTTDLRGVVALDDVRGRATVIASKDGEYAFYRGETVLQPQLATGAAHAVKNAAPKPAATRQGDFKEQARNMYMQNSNEIVTRNSQNLQEAMKGGKGSVGLEAGMAF